MIVRFKHQCLFLLYAKLLDERNFISLLVTVGSSMCVKLRIMFSSNNARIVVPSGGCWSLLVTAGHCWSLLAAMSYVSKATLYMVRQISATIAHHDGSSMVDTLLIVVIKFN